MATPEQELRNLAMEKGGKYAHPCVAPEIALERTVRERMAALKTQDGKPVRDTTVYNIAEGRTHPTRPYARLLRKLKTKRVTREDAHNTLIAPQVAYLDEVYGTHTTGEHRPAA